MQCCHWWHHWHHMILMHTPKASYDLKCHVGLHYSCLSLLNVVMPFSMLLASCNTDAGANGIKLWKSHIAPHFDCFNIRNAIVPSTILSTSYDARACTNSITWPKSDVAPHFNCLDLRNVVVPLVVLSMSHDADTNAIASQDSNANARDSMWCQCWCQ